VQRTDRSRRTELRPDLLNRRCRHPQHAPRTGRPWTRDSTTPGTVCCRQRRKRLRALVSVDAGRVMSAFEARHRGGAGLPSGGGRGHAAAGRDGAGRRYVTCGGVSAPRCLRRRSFQRGDGTGVAATCRSGRSEVGVQELPYLGDGHRPRAVRHRLSLLQ
jgi:hypothetical protein